MDILQNLLEARIKKFEQDEVNIDKFAVKELKSTERKKLEKDLAIMLLGGYKCKYCGKELRDGDEIDLHHGKESFSDMLKRNPELKRHETPWHIVNQTEFGRGIAILCPRCHRKTTALEKTKKANAAKIADALEDNQGTLFKEKEIEKYHKMSENRIEKKEEIASLFKQSLTPEDYKNFIDEAHKKQVTTMFREIMNSYIISFVINSPAKFNELYLKKKRSFKEKKDRDDFYNNVVLKLKNRVNYYYKKLDK